MITHGTCTRECGPFASVWLYAVSAGGTEAYASHQNWLCGNIAWSASLCGLK